MSSPDSCSSNDMSPIRRMRRATIACTKCRIRKVKCERIDSDPYSRTRCKRCTHRNLPCEYVSVQEQEHQKEGLIPSSMVPPVTYHSPPPHSVTFNTAPSAPYIHNGESSPGQYTDLESAPQAHFFPPHPSPDHAPSQPSFNRLPTCTPDTALVLASPPPGPPHTALSTEQLGYYYFARTAPVYPAAYDLVPATEPSPSYPYGYCSCYNGYANMCPAHSHA